MKQSQSSKLYLRCPLIYRGRHEGPMRNLMYFGFECGPGWFDIIYHLSVQIESIAVKMKNNDIPEAELPLVVQVKEKFGGLRFYMENMTREIRGLVENACEQSKITCDSCGAEGSLYNNKGWYRTSCMECRK